VKEYHGGDEDADLDSDASTDLSDGDVEPDQVLIAGVRGGPVLPHHHFLKPPREMFPESLFVGQDRQALLDVREGGRQLVLNFLARLAIVGLANTLPVLRWQAKQ